MDCTAFAPSPTAEATRLTEVNRTSPAAKTVGTLVSNGSGARPSAVQVTPRSSGSSWASVRMKPALSRARPGSHWVAGRAPMKQNRPRQGRSETRPVVLSVRVMRCSVEPPDRAVTSVWAWELMGRSPTWFPELRAVVLVAGLAAAASPRR